MRINTEGGSSENSANESRGTGYYLGVRERTAQHHRRGGRAGHPSYNQRLPDTIDHHFGSGQRSTEKLSSSAATGAHTSNIGLAGIGVVGKLKPRPGGAEGWLAGPNHSISSARA